MSKKLNSLVPVLQSSPIPRLERAYTADMSDELDLSADKGDNKDDGAYHLINYIKHVQNKYVKADQNLEPKILHWKSIHKLQC
jgi:hypothetical protein